MKALLIFTRQFTTMLRVGVPMDHALRSLTLPKGDALFVSVCPQLARQLQGGYSLSNAMKRHRGSFPDSYVALVTAAEASGQLVEAMERLGNWLERSISLSRRVQTALTYPAFVVVLAAGLTFVLFRTVIPGILETLRGMGVELPWPTRILAGLVAASGQPLVWIALALVVGGLLYYLRTPAGQLQLHEVLAATPVIRRVFVGSCAARYASTLALLHSTGVDLLQATVIASYSSGSLLLKADSDRVRRLLMEGKTLSYSLRNQPIYPNVLHQLVKVAEQTGKYDRMLEHARRILEDDASYRLDRLTALMEPVILAALSLLVGMILVAILLPLVNLASSL